MTQKSYSLIKKSQAHLLKKTPFYSRTKEGEFIIYKEKDQQLGAAKQRTNKHPELYINAKDKNTALAELSTVLNMDLARSIASKGFKEVKTALCKIVEEALSPNQEKMLDALPETIEILLNSYAYNGKSLEYLTRIDGNSSLIIEHTVNVLALTMQYCFFHNFADKKIKELAFCALLHDIGTSQIDKAILEANYRLSDKEFKTFKTHSAKGHDLIIAETDFDSAVATVALEHHERIDGSGYPNGIKKISSSSQLIGIIDCYEPLTYHDKDFRKAKTPFETLKLIKEEVQQGKFDKKIFKNFTSCLIK